MKWGNSTDLAHFNHKIRIPENINGLAEFSVPGEEVVDRVRPYEPFTLRNDLRGKFAQMKGTSLDDAELARIFDGVVLEPYCIKQMQRGRDHGMTVDQIYDDSIETITIEALNVSEKLKQTPSASPISKESFEAMEHELESLEMTIARGQETPDTDARIEHIEKLMHSAPWVIDMDRGVVVPLIPVVIRCDHSSLGVLTGYTHRVGEYDHQSGSVQAVVTPSDVEQLKQFPADFAIFELKPLESTLAKSDHTKQKKPELSSNDNTPSQ